MAASDPVGIFDSGVGGLTVVASVRRLLPNETIVYLGDTARVPYGSKSPDVVRRYALNAARFLVARRAKIVVIACNTASAHALDAVRKTLLCPVLGVIEPGAQLAARDGEARRIGVIGTEGTVQSGSYQRALAALAPAASVLAQPCPLFVPLAEEGLIEHAATRLLAAEYLAPLVAAQIDTLVLGCTHYPLLRAVIAEVVGPEVRIIDSATAVAEAIRRELGERNLLSSRRAAPDRFYATDTGERFRRVGGAFLGTPIDRVEHVDL